MSPRRLPLLVTLVLLGCDRPPARRDAAEIVALVEQAMGAPVVGPRALDVSLPQSARAPVRLTAGGVSLEIAALDLRDVPAERAQGATVFRDALPDVDVVWIAAAGAVEELRVLRSTRAATVARYRLSGARTRMRGDDVVEVLDRDGRVSLATAPMFAVDARGNRRALHAHIDGGVLETTLDARGLSPPIVVDPAWTTVDPMSQARARHTATLLKDGRVLVTGGSNGTGGGYLSTVEVFNPTSKSWSSLPSLSVPRAGHSATLLASGKVLVTGGTSGGSSSLSSSQLFDPTAGTWAPAAPLSVIRADHTATLLPSNKVLIAGGTDLEPGGEHSSAELYDEASNAWSSAGTMAVNRRFHTATLLLTGTVLVAGGRRGGATLYKTSDLYDPATNTWTPAGDMLIARGWHAAALLSGGSVLVAGGDTPDSSSISRTSKAELFDPVAKTWSATSSPMSVPRTLHSATALPGNRVLIIGSDDPSSATTELFTLSDGRFAAFVALGTMRRDHVAIPLPSGDILVTGGSNTAALASVELLTLGKPGDACTDGVRDCASGFCVDGVCCNTACQGQCEACDVAAARGTCSPATGKPHGARTACAAGASSCEARSCDGADRVTCAAFAGVGTTCAAASCADGAARPSATCDGKGACAAATAMSCAPYACGGAACRTSCATDADCSGSNLCDTSKGLCVGAETTCTSDGLASQPLDRSVPPKQCSPYRCDDKSGKCFDRCTTSDSCAAGSVCDLASGTCVFSATEDDGGCALGAPPRSSRSLALVAMLIAGLAAVRRRRR